MPFVPIDAETRIFYTVKEPTTKGTQSKPFKEGQPCETIVFISGWTSDHNFWIPYLPYFKNIRCVVFDNRGVGETIIPANKPITLQGMVDDVYALINHLKLSAVIVLGISMGGMIAQNFVIKYPQLCKKLILISTCAWLTPKLKYMFEKLVLLEESNLNLFVDILLGHCYANKVWTNLKLFSLYEQTCEYKKKHPQSPGNCRKQKEAIAQHDTVANLKSVKIPTLIIGGKEDELIPIDSSHELHTLIPQSDLLILPDEGHVPVEYTFLKQALEFLEK
jgi:3-oxoadipate enol-lactonase